MDFRTAILADVVRTYRNYKKLAESAITQIADDDLHTLVDFEANSIAIIMKHVGGNLRSRFTDFLTSDGEKPDRNRDDEFEMPEPVSRAELLALWERGWAAALGAVEALTPDDLDRTVTIRGEPFLVAEALNRSVTHTAYHVGQIVLLAKHFAGSRWSSLSIPKERSADYAKGTFKAGIIPRQETP
ncbi:MAG: DUF1572 family protein [Thermoanaerobaculia bacterium]